MKAFSLKNGKWEEVEVKMSSAPTHSGRDIDRIVIDKDLIPKIEERCGESPVGDGLECTHCGAPEVWKNKDNPADVNKWWFMIRAYRVDDYSECRNCGQWFR